ncbi:MAG: protoporphyrinogen oxidase [Bacillales bacterium]|nr:protoporphyrinogen oxidase [Bacillales bacterium]
MEQQKQNIVVIGGGLTGLTSAFYLDKKIKEENLPYQVVLVESSARLGGKMQTVYRDDFIVERGPDSWLASKTAISDLVKEAGLGDALTYNTPGNTFICARGKLYTTPGGAVFGIPTQLLPFAKSSLIPWMGKIRAGLDLFVPKTKADGDIAMGPFFRRRLGNSLVDNLIEPLISGIYAGDLDQMSIMSTFPDLFLKEQKYGSLIVGMKAGRKSAPKPQIPASTTNKPKGAFLSLSTGLESLATAIEHKLGNVQILKETSVENIEKINDLYQVELSNKVIIEAAAIIVSAGHESVPKMFSHYDFLNFFKEMPSTSVVNVTMAFPKEAVEKDINGGSMVVARTSGYNITSCSWNHKKWPHTAPEGHVLMRVYVGKSGSGNHGIIHLSDEKLEEIALNDVSKHIKLIGKPIFSVVSRWKESMPQYTVGHKNRMAEMKAVTAEKLPGVYFAGASYEGIGLSDCVSQGKQAVDKVLHFLNK